MHFSDSDREIPDYFPSCEDIFPLDDEFTPKEPHTIMDDFRNSVIDEDSQTQIFRVSRMNGGAEMQSDILSHYKNPSTRLKSPLKIRFEGEDGVGVGPIREFFVEALTIVEEGIGNPRVLMFEGESDHKSTSSQSPNETNWGIQSCWKDYRAFHTTWRSRVVWFITSC